MGYAGAILYEKDKILLQLRDKKLRVRNPGRWGIFGGGIKKGESPEQAIQRELKEELELEINKIDLILETEFKGEKIYIFKKKIRDIFSLRLKEGKKMGFFSKSEIMKLKNTVPGLKNLIKNYA